MPPEKKRVVKRRPMAPQAGGSWLGDAWGTVKKSGIIRNMASAVGGPLLGGIAGIAGLGKKPRRAAGIRGVLKF